jgi:hypothetical protein
MPSTADEQPVSQERQRRNRRWVAAHGGVMTVVPAILFGLMGLRYGSTNDDKVGWLNAPVAGVLGALIGGLIGYGISAESRVPKPTGMRRVLTVVAVLLCLAAVVGMRYLRHST